MPNPTIPNFYPGNTVDPAPSNDGYHTPVYYPGDMWLNTKDGKIFQCRDNSQNAARWVLLDSMLSVRDFGATGLGTSQTPPVDDTAALLNAVRGSALTSYRCAVLVPGGEYLISDGGGLIGGGAGNTSNQVVTLYGSPSAGSFTLTVTVWTPATGSTTQTTAGIASNATGPLLTAYLAALSNVGSGNVNVTGPSGGPYFVTFNAGLHGPVMSATSSLTGGTSPAVGVGDANMQTLTVTGAPTSATINLTITTNLGTQSFTITNWSSSTTAATIQAALIGASNIGNAVSVTGPNGGPYTISFGPSLGAPATAASLSSVMGGNNPAAVVGVIQAGAAIQLSKTLGLRLVGESGSQPDSQSTGGWQNRSSRSSLIWGGSNGGIMIAIDAYYAISVENVTLSGTSNANTPPTYARIGIIFSDINGFTGGNSTLRNCNLTAFNSPAPTASPPLVGACVQFALNVTDPGAAESKFFGCVFGPPPPTVALGVAGVRLLNNQSLNHQIIACDMGYLDVGIFCQAGGCVQWLGGSVEKLNTVLKLGTGLYPYEGGGPNAATFILQNLRTESPGYPGANVTLVDAGYVAGLANIIVEGWNDTVVNPYDPTPALVLGAAANVVLRDSVVQRGTPTALAVEPGNIIAVNVTNPGSGYNPASPPTVTFTGPPPTGGTAPTAIALIGGIALGTTSVAIDNAGSGYITAPTVTFDAPPSPGTFPQGYSVLNPSGGVDHVVVTYGGSGYTASQITVHFSAPGSGQTATGHANPLTGQVSAVTVTGYGSGYGTAPAVSFSSGAAAATAVMKNGIPPGLPIVLNGPAEPMAQLRLENVAGANAALCAALTTNTKVDMVASGVPEVSTIAGHFRYSKLNWAILQQNPKNFWDLGDIGIAAPNQGYNYYNQNLSPPFTDGWYTNGNTTNPPSIPSFMVQNVQSVVSTDAIGGFNTFVSGSYPTGWVNLRLLNNGGLGVAPATSGNPTPGWTIYGRVKRNVATGGHAIISNLPSTAGVGGFEVGFDSATNKLYVTFDGGPTGGGRLTAYSVNPITQTTTPIDFMITVDPPSPTFPPQVRLYLINSSGQAYLDGSYSYANYMPLYVDPPSTVPTIGRSGAGTIANLQIARLATWDTVLITPSNMAILQNFYNLATGIPFAGR